MMLLRKMAAWVLMLACFGSVPVYALDPLVKDDQLEAMTAYMEARRAFESGDLDAAAYKAERAYLISPTDPEVRNLMRAVQQARMSRAVRNIPQAESVESYRNSGMPVAMQAQGGREQEPMPGQKRAAGMPEVTVTGKEQDAPESAAASAGEPWYPRLSFANLFNPQAWLPQDPQEGRFEVLTDPSRAGYQRFYKEGIGAQPLVPGFGVSARTEIYEDVKPIDGHIIQAKQMGLDEIGEFRRAILPIFTRSWAFRAVADYEPFPRFTYEFDKRHIYHEFETRFGFKDRNLETHYFSLLYSLPEIPYLGVITLQPSYKRVFQESDDSNTTYSDIDEAFMAISVRPHQNVEYFFQWNGQEQENVKSDGNHITNVYTTQLRLAFPDWKVFMIPSFEYSVTDYSPGDDEFIKKDIFVDWGVDITDRLRASSKEQIVISEVSQSLQANTNPTSEVFNTFNKLSYEVVENLDFSVGLDYAKARGINAFDNYALRTEMEFFRPGILRASVGYKWVDYYNINDDLSLLFFKMYLFQ